MGISLLISACGGKARSETTSDSGAAVTGKTVEYTLLTNRVDGQMALFGVGGGIDGVKNPMFSANVGDLVKVTLASGDGVEHDVAFPDFNAVSEHISGKFTYNCVVAGHKEAGMIGAIEVKGTTMNEASNAAPSGSPAKVSGPVLVNNPATKGTDIVREPTEIPATIPAREPQTVQIDLETVEIDGRSPMGRPISTGRSTARSRDGRSSAIVLWRGYNVNWRLPDHRRARKRRDLPRHAHRWQRTLANDQRAPHLLVRGFVSIGSVPGRDSERIQTRLVLQPRSALRFHSQRPRE